MAKSKMEKLKEKASMAEEENPKEDKAEGGVEEGHPMAEEMCKKCPLMKKHMGM